MENLQVPHSLQTLDTQLGETCVTAFDGEGPTVVLVPGTNFSTAASLELVTALAAENRVVSTDLPGQPGLSSPDRHRHANDLYGVWLSQLVKELGIDSCILIGHSLGARVMFAASVRIPGATHILALDPAGITRLRIGGGMLLTSGRWFRRKDEDSSRALLALMMAGGATVPEYLVEWMTLVAQHVKTTLAPPALPPMRLKQIDVPVRIMSGETDIFLPQRRLRWGAKKIKDVHISWVENAGHLMPLEHPDVVVRALRDLRRVGH